MSLLTALKEEILLFDGAMGTMLQSRSMPQGGELGSLNLSHPEVVRSIHEEYVAAGADIITANTFQANSFQLSGNHSIEKVIHHGIALAKESGARYVAMDIGPLGQLFEPLGTMTFETAYDEFRTQGIAAERAGADCVALETFGDLLELKIAVLAIKENTNLPVFSTLSFEESGRTFMGVKPLSAVFTLQGLGVDALGVNCSLGPVELLPLVERMLEYASVPVMVQANAGLPTVVDGEVKYLISPQRFASHMEIMLDKGVAIFGGCCGTTPEFISLLNDLRSTKKRIALVPHKVTVAVSSMQTVVLGRKAIAIGEAINATNNQAVKRALLQGDMDDIIELALDQVDAGAKILDINLGDTGEQEPALQAEVVREVQAMTSAPLQISSTNLNALEAGLRGYNGKPMVHSLDGTRECMDQVFPLVKKYGATVICATFDEKGIPKTAEGLFSIAEKIILEAESYGIAKENLIMDCLVLPEVRSPQQKQQTLRAAQRVKHELGVTTTLGISNISIGGQNREEQNIEFLASALEAGLDAPLLDALSPATMAVVAEYNQR